MKFLYAFTSLLSAAIILPSASSLGVSHDAREVRLIGKAAPRVHGAVAEARVPRTNAERFAQGLPPLPPTRSRKRGSPTRRDTVSPVPLTTYHGNIEVSKADGTPLGHLGAKGIYNTYYSYTTDANDKLVVSFSLPTGQSSGSGLDLLTQNSGLSSATSAPYLGFAAPSSDPQASTSYAWLTSTSQTTNTPTTGGSSGTGSQYIESCAWTINVVTGAMSASWTNLSGTTISMPLLDDNQAIMMSLKYVGTFTELVFKFVPI